MEKFAETEYPIEEILRRRWSPRAFSDRMVEPEKLRQLFEAARWAPSSFNEQPWVFVVATMEKPEEHAQLLKCLVEGNQKWARRAPVLIVSVAKLKFDRTGAPNRHALHDVGLAVGNLMVQATALDLFVHQMAGFSVQQFRETYAVPEDFNPVAAIAVGYAPDKDAVPEELKAFELSPRVRKPVSSFVFEGQWGQTAAIVSK